MKRNGFTLIELLVVISIITLLVSIILPSVGKARLYAKQVVCSTNLKAIGTGFIMYMDEHPGYLPDAVGRPSDNPPDPNEIIISDVMETYVPKKAWKCPADDQAFFEKLGTSYEYLPGHILTAASGMPAFQDVVYELVIQLVTTGDDGTVAALQPGASPEVLEQISRPWPLALDMDSFHPTSKMPEGLQAVFYNSDVLLIDWQDLESMMSN
ncbi:MAG: prepilin-type N-terminal cleavage/methylation domain-containing protein [Phycisphaerae bacterium]|nr:prepilin-type N-terminal cleavage/methylation domain-containing protein [Phycisphaerae bacterium]